MCVAFLPVGLPGTYSYYLSDKYFLPYNFAVPVPYPCQGPLPVPVPVAYLYRYDCRYYGKALPGTSTRTTVLYDYIIPLSSMTALYVRSIPTGNYYRYDMTVQYVQVLTDPW
jgi:hypothetical protein